MNLGFQAQFVPFVEDGSKTHTIRADKRWKVGMRADLYAESRRRKVFDAEGRQTAGMRLLFRAVVTKVEEIEIWYSRGPQVAIDGIALFDSERDLLAWRDGFRHRTLAKPTDTFSVVSPATVGCFDLMMDFWAKTHNLAAKPFHGQIIHWDYAQRFMEKPRKAKRRPTLEGPGGPVGGGGDWSATYVE